MNSARYTSIIHGAKHMNAEAKEPMGCSMFILWVIGWITVPWLAFIVLLCVNKTVRDVTLVLFLIAVIILPFLLMESLP